ncbi:MAG: ribonuclease P protein component [Candidatus Hydrogenedentes bacterium]|nr:ribonuclease P protein component [Candidatus Hydrogenedentota bacterium]
MPERYLYPRTVRLLRKSDFDQVFSKGKKVWGPHFIGYLAEAGGTETRLGLVVSRKVGNAVTRNRMKRLIREFFRHHQMCFPAGTELIVVARVSSSSLTGSQCIGELQRMFGPWLHNA